MAMGKTLRALLERAKKKKEIRELLIYFFFFFLFSTILLSSFSIVLFKLLLVVVVCLKPNEARRSSSFDIGPFVNLETDSSPLSRTSDFVLLKLFLSFFPFDNDEFIIKLFSLLFFVFSSLLGEIVFLFFSFFIIFSFFGVLEEDDEDLSVRMSSNNAFVFSPRFIFFDHSSLLFKYVSMLTIRILFRPPDEPSNLFLACMDSSSAMVSFINISPPLKVTLNVC
mmetsp:Transcript_38119/g.49338  ORF Transcript_38119/g.49338 Transcript_38119/m.49338 type:complete len:224 (-) Transcript_38119:864-1535(-)